MQSAGDRFQHAIHVCRHVVIPESQNPIIVVAQPLLPCLVAYALGMLAAIHLYDQPLLTANKVNNETSYWLLPDKLVTVNQAGSQSIPKLQFSIGRIAAKATRQAGRYFIGVTHR